jgi:hypothetical protein
MLAILITVALLVLVVAVSLRSERAGIKVRSCCGARPWPPDDLAGDQVRPR